jgi:hypothetical protein
MSRFSNALKRGMARIQSHASEQITYSRGDASHVMRGVRGDKEADERDTEQESRVQGVRVDWIIEAAQMETDNGPIVPQSHDQIADASGAKYLVVKDPNDGKPWRWMPHRVAVRIHTMMIQGES